MKLLLDLQREAPQRGHPAPQVEVQGGGNGGIVHTLLEEDWVVDGRVETRDVDVGVRHSQRGPERGETRCCKSRQNMIVLPNKSLHLLE